MNTFTLEKVLLIQTRECFSSTFGHLMQDSIARLKDSVGCVRCQLNTEEHRLGRWSIHCGWNSIDAMQASFDDVFQPTLDTLIAQNALLSIQVSEAPSAGASHGAY